MKGIMAFIGTCYSALVFGQELALPEGLQLLHSADKQSRQLLIRKGFYQLNNFSFTASTDSTGVCTVTKTKHPYSTVVAITQPQANNWEHGLLLAGFEKTALSGGATRYIKDDITVLLTPAPPVVNIVVEKRNLPGKKEIRYAEDLLAFNSHRQVARIFGNDLVVRDSLVHADGTLEPCTVLMPNTAWEVIFIWTDKLHNYGLQQIRIGGNRHTQTALQQNGAVAQSNWISRQGVYPGMRLWQLEQHHGQPLRICSGTQLCATEKGRIDFRQLNLELRCLYCPDAPQKTPVFTATPTDPYNSMFVATLILQPAAH